MNNIEFDNDEYDKLKDEGFKSIREKEWHDSFERAQRDYESYLNRGGYYDRTN